MAARIKHPLALFSLTLLLFGAFAYLWAVPVWDSDFWWHIAAGRHIVDAGALPASDPFHVFEGGNPIRSDTVLKGQWLGQVLLYGLYQLAGTDAVIAGRVALLLVCLYLVYQRLRMQQLPAWAVMAVTLVAGFGLYGFTGDRPQLFSTLLMALTFWSVDRAEYHDSARPYAALPLIALLWAQIHGGVILAWVLLGALWLVTAWQQYRSGSGLTRRLRLFTLALALFGLATIATPNGLTTYAYILNLQGSGLQAATSEYVSSLLIYRMGFVTQQVWVYIALALALLGALTLVRRSPARALLLLLLLGLSIESYRYFVFLLVAGIPYAAAGVSAQCQQWRRSGAAARWLDAWGGGIIALVALLLVLGPYNVDHSKVFTSRYPVALAQQLEGQAGKVLSLLRWGGYLLWHNPSLTPYLDGRMLDDAKLAPYRHMIWATPEGQRWFQEQQFDWVLMPHRSNQGEPYRLNSYLRQHPRWQLYATTEQGVIFKARAEY